MKIYGIKDSKNFLERINQCKGGVKILTSEGDRLNLKSKLCQFIILSDLFKRRTNIPEMELLCEDPNDIYLLIDYIISHDISEDLI